MATKGKWFLSKQHTLPFSCNNVCTSLGHGLHITSGSLSAKTGKGTKRKGKITVAFTVESFALTDG